MCKSFVDSVKEQLEESIFKVNRYYADHTDAIKKMNAINYILRSTCCGIKSLFCDQRKIVNDLLASDKFDNFSYLYNTLSRSSDRTLLSKIVARRLLSSIEVQLCDSKEEWIWFREVKNSFLEDIRHCNISLIDRNWTLYLMNMSKYGFNINFFVNNIVIFYSFAKRQYECREAGVYPRLGDVVIDAGGCYGDTALVFSTMVGESGKVFSFEMNRNNIEIFKKNCENNSELAKNIRLMDKPLYSQEDIEFYVNEKRAGSTIVKNESILNSYPVRSTTIDCFMDSLKLKNLNFIKMDIEGAELEALIGARNSIKRYKPQMALSVYHKRKDLDEIPKFVHELVPEYKFFLKHHSCSDLETVLYCTV